MSTVILSTSNPRSLRAVRIAADSGQWARCTTRNGQRVTGIPSQSQPNVLHLTTATSCSCADFRYRSVTCKHQLAMRLLDVLQGVN